MVWDIAYWVAVLIEGILSVLLLLRMWSDVEKQVMRYGQAIAVTCASATALILLFTVKPNLHNPRHRDMHLVPPKSEFITDFHERAEQVKPQSDTALAKERKHIEVQEIQDAAKNAQEKDEALQRSMSDWRDQIENR